MFLVLFLFSQKLLMIAKLGQGSSNMLPMQRTSDSDLVSPSGLVTPLGNSPAFSRPNRRSSSASSIMSVESDSDDESGFPTLNARVRSDSAMTSASSTHSLEIRGKDGKTEEKAAGDRQPQAELYIEEEPALLGAMARPWSESLGKISRSSSAPQKERPRVVDSSSLSRSSSAPQGPAPGRMSSLREGIIMKRRATDEQDESITSSSASLNDSTGDSEIQSPVTTSSLDFPSLPSPEPQQTTEDRKELQSPNKEEHSEKETSSLLAEGETPPSSPEKEVSPCVSSNEYDACDPVSGQEENSFEEPQGSDDDSSSTTDLAALQPGQTTGFQALQNLSDSLESTLKSNGPAKQTPHIKSQLIAQHKIQSAITPTEPQRKRSTLPRRSSPVVSRKSRPENLKRGQEKSDHDLNGILQKIRDASAASSTGASQGTSSGNQERSCKLGKLTKRSSENSRAPLKPDKSHYSASGDLIDSISKTESKKEKHTPMLNSRLKSMSLTDLLSIGRDLTNNRDKNKDKDMDKDRPRPHSSEPISPLTDEEIVSPTSPQSSKKEERKSRFSRLRRKSSRGGELKDGIASGPDIDPKRASRHFFKESLMLESS